MVTIKELAERYRVSYEAARRLVRRYEGSPEMRGHIHHEGRTLLIDDEGVELLDRQRKQNPAIVVAAVKNEELEALRSENQELLRRLADAQDRLLASQDKVLALTERLAALEAKEREPEPETPETVAAADSEPEPERRRRWWQFWRR